jgi:ribosomal protein L11 methyltransferase
MINVLSFEIDNALVDNLFELIDSDLFTPTCRHDAESNICRVEVFFEDASQGDGIRSALAGAAGLIGIVPEFESSQIEESDWAESWKRFFHVEHISRRIVIRPTWEDYTAKTGECVISLDPGMSFGTGKHATTKGCLMLLDDLTDECPGFSFLDMGCGSGILSIGAKLLGYRNVHGFDIDPDCVRISRENAHQNDLKIPFYEAGLDDPHPPAQVVVANILAPTVIQFAESIIASVKDDSRSRLILSGILDSQYNGVKECFEKLGLRELRNLLIEEWRSGVFGFA